MPKISKRDASLIIRFLFHDVKVKLTQPSPTLCAAYLNGNAKASFSGTTWSSVASSALTEYNKTQC